MNDQITPATDPLDSVAIPEGSTVPTPVEPELIVGGESAAATDAESIEQPAKVIRIGSMIKKLLEEVREAPLDEASRSRMKEIYESSVKELASGLSTDLRAELDRLALPFDQSLTPSDAELRIAQAQLVGWLEGLFHGIQATLVAQQAAMHSQLQQMQSSRGLPAGRRGEDDSDEGSGGGSHMGTYL